MNLEKLYEKALAKQPLTLEEGCFLISLPDARLDELLQYANEIKLHHVGKEVVLCGILNARSGKCSEDCSFCAQSAHHKTGVAEYPLLEKEEIVAAAKKAKDGHTGCFSIVTSGRGVVNNKDFEKILATVPEIEGMNRCVSLGILSKEQAKALKAAGLNKYHHNLEAAPSYFPEMCTTHTFDERAETIQNAKAAGLEVCVGGIFGIGENEKQRVELALEIKSLDPASVPINILHPVPGTKTYGKVSPLTIPEILKIIATFRFIMPDKIIGVFGGREYHLKEQQPKIFTAGANSILVGNYLTTNGGSVESDLQMIAAAGLVPKS
jgi:biotin synthase